jgi:hypothetical protein
VFRTAAALHDLRDNCYVGIPWAPLTVITLMAIITPGQMVHTVIMELCMMKIMGSLTYLVSHCVT